MSMHHLLPSSSRWLLMLLITVTALFIMLIGHTSAHSTANGVHTNAPPDMGIQGFFDPNHRYLLNGYGSIENLGNGSVRAGGSTTAKQTVSTVGVQMYVQRWNGVMWVNHGSSPAYTSSNTSTISAVHHFSVPTGYYYRLRTVHWTSHSGTLEQGSRTTSSIAIN